MLYFWYFYSSKNPKKKKRRITVSTKILSSTTVFNMIMIIIRNITCVPNRDIKMISERPICLHAITINKLHFKIYKLYFWSIKHSLSENSFKKLKHLTDPQLLNVSVCMLESYINVNGFWYHVQHLLMLNTKSQRFYFFNCLLLFFANQ